MQPFSFSKESQAKIDALLTHYPSNHKASAA
jgi:hypothetical protein